MNQDIEITGTDNTQRLQLPSALADEEAHQGFDLSHPQPLNPRFLIPPQTIDGVLDSSSFTQVPFADLPLYIPGITTPVIGYDGGINKAALDVHLDSGLLCNLLPYLDMAALDFIQLFYGDLNTPVATYIVTQEDVDKARLIPLYIKSSKIIDGPISPLFMRVTRVGGGSDETRRLRLLVDTVAPAGRNPVASTVQNENLHKPVFEQKHIDFGITQEDANVGVPVDIPFYPVDDSQLPNTFRAVRDRIRLSIHGHVIEHRVTEGEAAGREPIRIMIYAGTWAQISSGSHLCEYQIIDEVGNASQGWSPAQLIEVSLDDGSEPLLPEAFVDEAPEDSLDYDELDGQDATLRVFIRFQGYAIGDLVRLTINGRSADGDRIIKTYDYPVTSTTINLASVVLPNQDIRPLVGGRFQLSYVRIRSGTPDRRSRSIIVQVTGTPVDNRLSAPYVIEATGGILDPQLLFLNVVVRAYAGQNFFDLVTLILDGEYANGNRYYREIDDIAGSNDVLFLLNNGPTGDIAQLEGGTLRIYYRVTTDDGSRISQDITFDVGEPVASLPEVLVLQAPPPDYQFNPDVSPGNANIKVLANPDFLVGDTVMLYCEGNAPGGSVPPQSFPITNTWVGRDLPFTLARQFILPNQTMRIYYSRIRDNVRTRFSHSVYMKVGAALDLPVPLVLESTVLTPTTATLNPLHVITPPIFTLRVRYNGMLTTHDIKPYFKGKPGLGTPNISAKPGNPSLGYVDFQISNTAIAANLSHLNEVGYDVTEAGAISPSQVLSLQVQTLPAQVLDLVTIPEAQAGQVEVNKTYTVRVDGWPFMRQGQHVWIDLLSSENLPLRIGTVVSDAEFSARRIQMTIPADYLRTLRDADMLRVEVRVSLDGTGDKSLALALVVPPVYRVERASGVIEGTIAVGRTPSHLALSSDNSRLYVSNYDSNSVSVIDTATREVIHTINLPASPTGITVHPDGKTLYVGVLPNSTYVIETNEFQTTTTITLQYGAPIESLCLNPTGSRLYATNHRVNYLHEMNTTTNQFVRLLVTYASNSTVITNKSGSRIYATGDYVETVNQATLERLGYYPTGSTLCRGSAHSPNAEFLYQTTLGSTSTSGVLHVLSTLTVPVSLIVRMENLSQPWGVAFAPQGEKAYMCLYGDNSIKVINTSNHTIIGDIDTNNALVDRPKTIVISSDGKLAYVANSGNNNILIISL